MSRYQQDQAGWEWRDQEDERRHAENIIDPKYADDIDRLAVNQPFVNQMLANFDSIFGTNNKDSI